MLSATPALRENSVSLACHGNFSRSSGPARRPNAWLTPLFCTSLLLTFGSSLWAQSTPPVLFLGAPSPVITSGISFPINVAADTSGNVYIADFSKSAVYKETLQGNGSYLQSTVAGGLTSEPIGLAIDSAGNVYIGFYTNGSLLKETLQVDGSYIQSQIASGLGEVWGIAVDSSGNIYAISNASPDTVLKLIPSESTYTSSVIYTAPAALGGWQWRATATFSLLMYIQVLSTS
jgi:hypothetical protein